ncbi:hypothetical protein U9M48_025560 [Paspalum notatum var. saurae]|uniref:Defensin n=1 Tax=Paspalum notatum var. saurae TaxID=547442 RepID=A0AAQ3TQN1_PASNO
MARKTAALVASALLLLAVVFMSLDAGGVDAYCLEFQSTINACRGGSNGLRVCCQECLDLGYNGGDCKKDGECACLKCADQKTPVCEQGGQ